MTTQAFTAFLFFSIIMCITPGAGNITLLGIANRFGFVSSLPFILGTSFGVFLVFAGSSAGIVSLLTSYPNLYDILKYVGAIYLLYIAWSIATFKMDEEDDLLDEQRIAGFGTGALIQLLNPKAWITAMTIFTQFINTSYEYVIQVVFIVIAFTIVTFLCTSIWAYFGSMLKKLLKSPHHLLWINRGLAMMLVFSVISMLGQA